MRKHCWCLILDNIGFNTTWLNVPLLERSLILIRHHRQWLMDWKECLKWERSPTWLTYSAHLFRGVLKVLVSRQLWLFRSHWNVPDIFRRSRSLLPLPRLVMLSVPLKRETQTFKCKRDSNDWRVIVAHGNESGRLRQRGESGQSPLKAWVYDGSTDQPAFPSNGNIFKNEITQLSSSRFVKITTLEDSFGRLSDQWIRIRHRVIHQSPVDIGERTSRLRKQS